MVETKTKFQKYSAYKDSGVEWIGKIPEGWEVYRFRNVFSFRKGLNITKENLQETGIPCINYGEIHSKFGFEVNPEIHKLKCVENGYIEKSSKSLINFGDFIFADTSEDIEGSGNFTYLNSDKIAFAGYHTIIAQPSEKIRQRYVAYLFDSISFRNQIRRKVKGVKVYSITNKILKDTILWLPPIQERNEITNFLDNKTTKINQAIAQKEELISLLKERKQIVIQNAVTKGLNSKVKMKDSCVEWIGEIPEHWEVRRCKYLFYETSEKSEDGSEELLSVSHMTGVTTRAEKDVNMFLAEDYTGSKLCQKDDLVYNIMWAWMGALGISPQKGIVSPSYGIYRQENSNTFNSDFLELKLKTTKYIQYYNQISTGLHSSRLRFYAHMFMDMEIAYPGKKEQDEIAHFINTESTKIDQAITLQQTQIKKLKEYKATLIDSAVTGKIKVV